MGIKCFMLERVNERREYYDTQHEHYHLTFDVRRVDTGEIIASDVSFIEGIAPVGAMWWQEYREDHRATSPNDHHPNETPEGLALPAHPSFFFEDGPCLCVKTPGGGWRIDSRANNCTMPYDLNHRCWIRHGDPPNITVDKAGVTCQAGAGSIGVGGYHGFLRNGELVPA